jgi:hypothetical protein
MATAKQVFGKIGKYAWKAVLILIAAVLVTMVVFSCITLNAGLKPQGTPVSVTVAKSGSVSYTALSDNPAAVISLSGENRKDTFNAVTGRYAEATKFVAMRGILENVWFPSAKLDNESAADKFDVAFLDGLTAGDLPTGTVKEDGTNVTEFRYLVTLFYAAPQTAALKDGDGNKITVSYDRAVFTAANADTLENVDVYVFLVADYNSGFTDSPVSARKVTIKAQQSKLFAEIKKLFQAA